MAQYPIKMLKDENGNPFIPLVAPEAVINTDSETLPQLLSGKISEPASDGTAGQVLTTDGTGGRSWTTVSGGGGGTSDYTALSNKPQINSTTLSGNKSSSDLGLQDALVSGTNIKTINSTSILGSGNLNVDNVSVGTTQPTNNEELWVKSSPNSEIEKSYINVNNNGTYNKLTDTLNIGVEPNNSGLWVEHSKNLLDINNKYKSGQSFTYYGITITYNENGSITLNGTSTGNGDINVVPQAYSIKLKQNIYLHFEKLSGTSSKDTLFAVEAINKSGTSIWTYGVKDSMPTKEIPVSEIVSVRWLRIPVSSGDTFTNYKIRLWVSTTNDTTYEPYTTPSIKVNNNGVYETIVNKNVYSSSEVVIGEWFGKPLYRKVFQRGAFTNLTTITQSCDISNVDKMINIDFGFEYQSRYYYSHCNMSEKEYDKTNNIASAKVSSSLTATDSWFILEYTKTTD